jgi:hypothetical protein
MITIQSSKFPFQGSRSGSFAVPSVALAKDGHSPVRRNFSEGGPFSLLRPSFVISFLLICSVPRAIADDATETRLRETLRSTVLQLRDAQNQMATLQNSQAESDQKNKELTDQVALLKKHSIEDKSIADNTIAGLETKAAAQDAEIAKLLDALEKWKADDRQFHDTAGVAEAERAKLAEDNFVLQRRVAYLETKNVQLFTLGNEILSRYENFSLGNAISAKEPFVGVTRVKLENLVQDYSDKLLDQRAAP